MLVWPLGILAGHIPYLQGYFLMTLSRPDPLIKQFENNLSCRSCWKQIFTIFTRIHDRNIYILVHRICHFRLFLSFRFHFFHSKLIIETFKYLFFVGHAVFSYLAGNKFLSKQLGSEKFKYKYGTVFPIAYSGRKIQHYGSMFEITQNFSRTPRIFEKKCKSKHKKCRKSIVY